MKRAICALLLILVGSAIGSAQQLTYYYPHLAIGTYPGGSWQTTILLTNSTGSPANGSVTFTQSNGTPFTAQWVDEVGMLVSSGNLISFQLGPQQTRKYVSLASGPLATGFATVTANAAVMGTGIFTQFDGSGRLVGEAGVPSAIPLGRQAIFVDTTKGFSTGVAIANPNNLPLNITFQLVTTMGTVVASVQRQLPANQHTAFFTSELFPIVAPLVGRLQFWCTNPMTSVGFRFDPSGALFTTLPPVAIQ